MIISLFALGLPISQGAISTILGVLAFFLAPSYIFITFFKMIFLVIILGALHGIFLLPVLLAMFGPGVCDKGAESEDGIEGGGQYHHHHHHQQEMKIPRPSTITGGASGTKQDMMMKAKEK